MTPADVGQYIKYLEMNGLVFVKDGKAIDVIVVDQLEGPTGPCDWIEYSHIDYLVSNSRIACCRMAGCNSNQVAFPQGWEYERSVSSKASFISNVEVKDRLHYLRNEDGVEVYYDMKTGEERYVGRAESPTMKVKPYSLVAPDGKHYFFSDDGVVMASCVDQEGKEELLECDSREILDRYRHERPECCFVISRAFFEKPENVLLPDGIQNAEQLPSKQRMVVNDLSTLQNTIPIFEQIWEYTRAIQFDPKDFNAYCNRGRAYLSNGEYDKAISDYTEAIRLDPKNAGAFFNRGLAYGSKGQFDKSTDDINDAYRLDPANASAYFNDAKVYFNQISSTRRRNESDAGRLIRKGLPKPGGCLVVVLIVSVTVFCIAWMI